MTEPVLRLEGLSTSYYTKQGIVRAVDGVSFSLMPGERLGLVGESGSGKSTIAYSLLHLVRPPGRVTAGKIYLNGREILSISDKEMRNVRLKEMAMIPQGAMNSLNPVARVKDQIIDGLADHGVKHGKSESNELIGDLLNRVGLHPSVKNLYPHELSGGMKQRVTIAIAISMDPKLIIADEPTSALDVVVQRQISETLMRLQEELGASIILIGHDMGLMSQIVDRVGVMYAGKMVEMGTVREVLKDPLHPYSRLLVKSLPSLNKKDQRDKENHTRGIPGLTPSLTNLPDGCYFHPRCPSAMEICKTVLPQFRKVSQESERKVACYLYEDNGYANGRTI